MVDQRATRPLNLVAQYPFLAVPGFRKPDLSSPDSSFCKYSVGVSKYASTKLTLNELGRFPIKIRSTVLVILYWLRLEHGTNNVLLNKAFDTTKQENHPWIQNIQYALWQIGLGDVSVWQNPKSFEKNQLKRILTTKLKDIYVTDSATIVVQLQTKTSVRSSTPANNLHINRVLTNVLKGLKMS